MDKKNQMIWTKRCAFYILSILICGIPLLGCQDKEEMSDPKASLERLAEEYWNKRLLDRDYKATYAMELEEGSLPFEEYLRRVANAGQIKYLSIESVEAEIEKDEGIVEFIIRYRIPAVPKDIESTQRDRWVVKSNQWKHILTKKWP